MPKKLTEKQKEEILKRYLAGELNKVVAADYDVSENYPSILARRVAELPQKARARRRRNLFDKRRKAARQKRRARIEAFSKRLASEAKS